MIPVWTGDGAPVGVAPPSPAADPASSTGHTVVETTTTSVTTDPIRAGQSVTDAAHDVTAYVVVA